MTSRRQDLAARRRGELNRERGSRRLSSTIDAQRRLNAGRAVGTGTKADPVGPSDNGAAKRSSKFALGGKLRIDMIPFERRG